MFVLKKIRERINVFSARKPSLTVLIAILLLNLALFLLTSAIISWLAPHSLANRGFWASVFYTVSMILDAGCMEYVISDVGEASTLLIIICVLTVLIGMITFTGAVVGYVTNYISNFIENSKSGIRALKASGHTVILNWNSRASEIVNDLLYTGRRELVVVLAKRDPDDIEREINERLSTTFNNDRKAVRKECEGMPLLQRWRYYRSHRLKKQLTVIVREGEPYSTKQLEDVSLSQAKTVLLLADRRSGETQTSESGGANAGRGRGNANTLRTLVQVAEMTSNESSADAQTIVVEIEDDWTGRLVERIIAHKENLTKCRIIPVYVHVVLGQILSQFSVMPELNAVYSELFSNRGAEFFFKPCPTDEDELSATENYMLHHRHAIPLTIMQTASGIHAFSVANSNDDCEKICPPTGTDLTVRLNPNYHMLPRSIVIIGHNSKSRNIMNGFTAFRGEHKRSDSEILNVTVIDDEEHLKQLDYYRSYPYVKKTVAADVFDAERIKSAIEYAVDSHEGDTSVLILSDDEVPAKNMDAAALTYLIYMQDIIMERQARIPDFDRESIDVVVEILNPKNYDIVHNYSADNVIISNRYVSKMVTQIGRKQPLFEFFSDILTYDSEDAGSYDSKELYIKEAELFFENGQLPPRTTARDLIVAIYTASPANNKEILLGYVSPGGRMTVFSGDQSEIEVELKPRDKLIIFSNH